MPDLVDLGFWGSKCQRKEWRAVWKLGLGSEEFNLRTTHISPFHSFHLCIIFRRYCGIVLWHFFAFAKQSGDHMQSNFTKPHRTGLGIATCKRVKLYIRGNLSSWSSSHALHCSFLHAHPTRCISALSMASAFSMTSRIFSCSSVDIGSGCFHLSKFAVFTDQPECSLKWKKMVWDLSRFSAGLGLWGSNTISSRPPSPPPFQTASAESKSNFLYYTRSTSTYGVYGVFTVQQKITTKATFYSRLSNYSKSNSLSVYPGQNWPRKWDSL